ncbi:hypothetical protein WLU61_11515 [Bordetella bronchiseptica]
MATMFEPMLPPAPGLFSTTTVCPRTSVSCLATSRPSVSTAPPGANGTTMRIGWPGQASAAAAGAADRPPSIMAPHMPALRRALRNFLLMGLPTVALRNRYTPPA